MKTLTLTWIFAGLTTLGCLAVVCLGKEAQASTQLAIVSISVCSPNGAGGPGSCPSGSFDTHQIVLGPGGSSVNESSLGVGPAPDEHSSVFAPGTLATNQDYLFFLASTEGGNVGIGVALLSGGTGPDQNGQWTMDFAKTDGYGSYPGGFGQVFNPTGPVGSCPVVADGNPAHQDQTFDMHYAAPGSVVKDPTSGPGALLMVYEGTNACIGNAGGPLLSDEDDYISLAIATSLDYGKSWPTYRGTPTFNFVPLPGINQSQGPNAPMGALGENVCMGNDCASTPPTSYGRYPVVTPPTSLASLMAAGKPLTAKFGEQEISGFVDDVAGNPAPYLYVNSGDARVARVQLNGGSAPLTFQKWNGQAFASPGLGGEESSVLPAGPFENCEAPAQNQFGSSISYVEDTQQYLLTFVCVSPGDPALGEVAGAAQGAAWFYSTSYDLSDQTQWTTPREITGSWSKFDNSGGCPDYKGWYPTFMSLGKDVGHLSLTGYVFYLWGCQGAGTPGGRQFSSRIFTITTAPSPVVVNMSIAPPSLNFGSVNVGQSVDQTITITNQASSTAVLTGNVGTLSAPFSVVSGEGAFNLAPGESVTVTVRYSPTIAGSASASFPITHDATNQTSPTNISLSGTGVNVSVISVTPTSNNYGNVKVKRSSTVSFVVKNSGKANLSITSGITGPDASMFKITSGSGNKTIKPGKSLTIRIAFKPTSKGSKSANLVITSNDPVTPSINIPLSGIGQ